MKKRAIVIGAGFSGLATATYLADSGFDVTILEKNESIGGRARRFSQEGYTFDMGPSWYWMPDVFEEYFKAFGKNTTDYYELIRLDPSYRVVFGEDDYLDIPAEYSELKHLFNQLEEHSGEKLDKFLDQAAYKYKVGINDLVYKPSRSITEFLSLKLLIDVMRLDVFVSFEKHIKKIFRHPKILQLLEFPILFLGALAKNTPALYSLMNYADIKLGTWYPKGGMFKVIEGMKELALGKGVKIQVNQEVEAFEFNSDNTILAVCTGNEKFMADVVVASADYHFVEQHILPKHLRNYSDKYWETRTMAPSSLIFYLGVNKRIPEIHHHTLYFDEDFGLHSQEIYQNPSWPSKPLFYLSAPSKTDPDVAPEGHENLFILIPVAPGLKDSDDIREKYYDLVMDRLEKYVKTSVREHVVYKRSYAHNDFIQDYHAFKGNAYGLANTLRQTAILKPSLKNKKIDNLYYAGQLTVPGPGVPPSLISGYVVAHEINKDLN